MERIDKDFHITAARVTTISLVSSPHYANSDHSTNLDFSQNQDPVMAYSVYSQHGRIATLS